jgi:hypothetical protein
MRCTGCGHENPDGSRFCVECGAALAQGVVGESTTVILTVSADELAIDDDLPEGVAAAPAEVAESVPAGTAMLVVKRGPDAGSRLLLGQDVTTVGRHPDSDILLDDVTVSRRHVEFRRDCAEFAVHDQGSLNGTYVNRKPVDVVTLASGDEVQVGKFRFVYLTGSWSGESAAS